MIAAFLQVASDDGLAAAMQALSDAFAGGNIGLAIVAAVLIAAVVVLKFLGKKIPFVETGVGLVLGVARSLLAKKPAAPAEPLVKIVRDEDKGGVEGVIEVEKEDK